jgi:hypothetical protein
MPKCLVAGPAISAFRHTLTARVAGFDLQIHSTINYIFIKKGTPISNS